MKYLLLLLIPLSVFAKTEIAVIDTGFHYSQNKYLCKNGKISYKGTAKDNHGHGRNVIGLIASKMNTSKYCIVSYKFYDPNYNGNNSHKYINMALKDAIKRNVAIINLSLSGLVPNFKERQLIKQALDKGIRVIVAAGNDGLDLDKSCDAYPSCYNFKTPLFTIVGAWDVKQSNFGKIIHIVGRGKNQGYPVLSGTSQATANYTGDLVSK